MGVERLRARAFTVPLHEPESDGTLTWDHTTVVVVEVAGDGQSGLGMTYGSVAVAAFVADVLAPVVAGVAVDDVPGTWAGMTAATRNAGRSGVGAMAVSAVDVALWDLKARCHGVPLLALLGAARHHVAAYASGGFTSLSDADLARELDAWRAAGFDAVKIKVGREPGRDAHRVALARDQVGSGVALYVDANGAYPPAGALAAAAAFDAAGVTWFEEPVSSDDLAGLSYLRHRLPPGMAVVAGEYAAAPHEFRRLLEAGAVDVLQADATRCGGVTGFAAAAALAGAFHVPLSAHTAPSLHATLCCAAGPAVNVEWFADHVRVERLLFDGALEPTGGVLVPRADAPGHGLTLKESDAAPYEVRVA